MSNKSGTAPQVISLPNGGGALRGIGETFSSGRKDRAAVGGVVLLALDQDALRTSSEGDAPLPDQEREYDLAPIENYGVTGTWFLSIEGLDLRNVADVRLEFVVSLEELDQNLEERVEQLIRNYEDELAGGNPLDQITAYSLEQHFPDTFEQLEGTGQGTFTLQARDFPPGTEVKAVVAQALDQDDEGIAGIKVEVSKPTTAFTLARTTVGMGFSEDINAEIPPIPEPERAPIQGTWQIRLLEPEQFTQLGDLNLFFIYEHRNV